MEGEHQQVDASVVRAWARRSGFRVGARGHLPKRVITKFNQRHHKKVYVSENPFVTWMNQQKEEADGSGAD